MFDIFYNISKGTTRTTMLLSGKLTKAKRHLITKENLRSWVSFRQYQQNLKKSFQFLKKIIFSYKSNIAVWMKWYVKTKSFHNFYAIWTISRKKNSQFFFNKVDNGIYIYIPFSLPFQFFLLVLKVFCVGSYYILIYI